MLCNLILSCTSSRQSLQADLCLYYVKIYKRKALLKVETQFNVWLKIKLRENAQSLMRLGDFNILVKPNYRLFVSKNQNFTFAR